MMKSFRNLILSLFLAAGAAAFAACEGERGPVGEAGPAGTAGAAGTKGATGDAGKSSEEIPSAYEFLKTWGKADGMAACNDDIFQKTEAFPGPAALAKVADANTKRVPFGNIPLFPNIGYSADPPVPADKGKCSAEVFADNQPIGFGFPGTFLMSEKMTETPKRGSTAVLGNPTLTTTEKQFWGGVVLVDMKDSTSEIAGMDSLFVRCNVGKRPLAGAQGTTAGSKRIEGEYRIALTTETENILGKDAGGSTVIKDSAGGGNDYELINYTTQICIRLPSVPGTVKCYVRMSMQERNAADDMRKGGPRKVTEQMVLYKDGKLTQVMPTPYSNGLLAGTGPANPNFPFGTGANAPAAANLDSVGKLCNFFDKGVRPCPSGSPGHNGACPP